ncbi:hypothetical protein EDD18DRAFT_1106982 [Armillaria luteobubalina]|uniref:Uncharacterized protein n=1 Tax=Armillaria luteobubalina TaxID=153913 RepID=A0AA39Q2G9_9AGAR|nr:hypothetical protein EDD18DRAFT_1106982 [Armillaria luteobubalina]
MAQPENIWMKLAALVVASVNPGTLTHTVAAIVIVGFSLSTILPLFGPDSMIETLNKTVEKTYTRYDERKGVLNEAAGFEGKINRLRVEAFKLQERHLRVRAYDDTSVTELRSWGRYMQEVKAIWVKAHQHQREIVELTKELELAIVRALRDQLEASSGHHSQGGRETLESEELDSSGRHRVVPSMLNHSKPVFESIRQPPLAGRDMKDSWRTSIHGCERRVHVQRCPRFLSCSYSSTRSHHQARSRRPLRDTDFEVLPMVVLNFDASVSQLGGE